MPIARSRSFVIDALAFACDRSSHRRATRALALVIVLGLHAGEATGDVARPRAYPPASTILVEPEASPYRAHVARMGDVSFTLGGEPSEHGGRRLELALEVPVVEENGDRVRVLVEDDDARSMVWLAASDLAWSIARPVRLGGRGDAGVWLTTGAPVMLAGSPRGGRRHVTYDDGAIALHGDVVARDVTQVFPASARAERLPMRLAHHLRIAPGGAVFYPDLVHVDVITRRGRWYEVEYRSRYVRIRGWVDRVTALDELGTSGTGSGGGIGMSDADRVDVPAGACLFDREGGHVVALQLAAAPRYVASRDGDWWQVYVGTPWGLLTAWGHSLGDVDGALAWERCDRPSAP